MIRAPCRDKRGGSSPPEFFTRVSTRVSTPQKFFPPPSNLASQFKNSSSSCRKSTNCTLFHVSGTQSGGRVTVVPCRVLFDVPHLVLRLKPQGRLPIQRMETRAGLVSKPLSAAPCRRNSSCLVDNKTRGGTGADPRGGTGTDPRGEIGGRSESIAPPPT
jgi:hypothetical protein